MQVRIIAGRRYYGQANRTLRSRHLGSNGDSRNGVAVTPSTVSGSHRPDETNQIKESDMSYIIVANPPHVENPLTEEDPVRFTTGSNIEELIAAGAPTVTRAATIESVEVHDRDIPLELLQKHVNGYIEVAYSLVVGKRSRESIDFIGDEEALLKKLTPTLVRPSDGWVLRGPLVVAYCTADGRHVGLAWWLRSAVEPPRGTRPHG